MKTLLIISYNLHDVSSTLVCVQLSRSLDKAAASYRKSSSCRYCFNTSIQFFFYRITGNSSSALFLSVFESSLDVLLCCFQRANRRESIFSQEEEVSSFCFKPIVLRIRYFEVAFNWLSTLFVRNKSNDKAEFCYSRISIKFAWTQLWHTIVL